MAGLRRGTDFFLGGVVVGWENLQTYSKFRVDGLVVDVISNVVDLRIVAPALSGRGRGGGLQGGHGGKGAARVWIGRASGVGGRYS